MGFSRDGHHHNNIQIALSDGSMRKCAWDRGIDSSTIKYSCSCVDIILTNMLRFL